MRSRQYRRGNEKFNANWRCARAVKAIPVAQLGRFRKLKLRPRARGDGQTTDKLSVVLFVAPTVANWLSRTLKEEKERKRDKAFALWLACHTQEEIAAAVEVTQNTISGWEKEFIEKCQGHNSINSPDFEVPIYNVWKQQTKTAGVNHFGNSEVRWLDNLLYLYTNPADIVVDPFAGSGSTIDLRACCAATGQ